MEEPPKVEEQPSEQPQAPAEVITEPPKEPAATESAPATSTTELTQEKKDQCK